MSSPLGLIESCQLSVSLADEDQITQESRHWVSYKLLPITYRDYSVVGQLYISHC